MISKRNDFLDKRATQPSKFRTTRCIEINGDQVHGAYYTSNQIKFKTTKLKTSSSDYNDADILKESAVIVRVWVDEAARVADRYM